VLLGIVVARLVQLQVVDHELFAEKSQGNRVRIEPVPPIRGLVFDRKGRVLACQPTNSNLYPSKSTILMTR
jgi:penicillin-binding protein 2